MRKTLKRYGLVLGLFFSGGVFVARHLCPPAAEAQSDGSLTTAATPSACSTLYSSTQTSAVVDPAISYGRMGTLILSFKTSSPAAVSTVKTLLGSSCSPESMLSATTQIPSV